MRICVDGMVERGAVGRIGRIRGKGRRHNLAARATPNHGIVCLVLFYFDLPRSSKVLIAFTMLLLCIVITIMGLT